MGIFSRSPRLDPHWSAQPDLIARMRDINDIANAWLADAGWTEEKIAPFLVDVATGNARDGNPFAGAWNAARHLVLNALTVAAQNFAKVDDRPRIEAILEEYGSRSAFAAVVGAIDAKTGKARLYGDVLLRHIDDEVATATPVVVDALQGLHA